MADALLVIIAAEERAAALLAEVEQRKKEALAAAAAERERLLASVTAPVQGKITVAATKQDLTEFTRKAKRAQRKAVSAIVEAIRAAP